MDRCELRNRLGAGAAAGARVNSGLVLHAGTTIFNNKFDLSGNAQFAVEIGKVELHGARADAQCRGNLLGGFPLDRQPVDTFLAPGQAVTGGGTPIASITLAPV